MKPIVSVIIPTHDRLDMLQEAVQSVRGQSLASWELIVVDDGSTDGTWRWLQTQSDLRTIQLPHRRGPAAARNRGAAAARAELLAFLDSDDLFLEHKLRRQVELMHADPKAALCHTNEIWLRRGKTLKQKKKHEKRGGQIFLHCLPLCRISPSAAMIRREIFERLQGFDEQLEVAEDYELWLRLTCQHRVAFIEEPLLIKRGGHPDQLSEKYGQIEIFRIEALQRLMRRAPLTDPQRRAVSATLLHKYEIYAQGCEKRGRLEEAAHYRALKARLVGAEEAYS